MKRFALFCLSLSIFVAASRPSSPEKTTVGGLTALQEEFESPESLQLRLRYPSSEEVTLEDELTGPTMPSLQDTSPSAESNVILPLGDLLIPLQGIVSNLLGDTEFVSPRRFLPLHRKFLKERCELFSTRPFLYEVCQARLQELDQLLSLLERLHLSIPVENPAALSYCPELASLFTTGRSRVNLAFSSQSRHLDSRYPMLHVLSHRALKRFEATTPEALKQFRFFESALESIDMDLKMLCNWPYMDIKLWEETRDARLQNKTTSTPSCPALVCFPQPEMGKDFRSETAEAVSRFHGSVRKAFTGFYRIKDFIRRLRATKTAHDERTLVAKESAAIRTSFKDPSVSAEHRYHSLGKLIYIYMMGYPALFGQVECMKLAATIGESQLRLKDKRLGYLGVTLLSDEHQETLTLVTNSLKYDLNHTDEAVVSLALSTLALCMSPAMARELAPEVDRLLHQPASPLLRKKATAAALKMIQKDPELAEEGYFEDRLTGLLSDKNASVVLGGVHLLTGLLKHVPASKHQKLLPMLVKLSKQITSSPFNPERDVSGTPDPLLQVAILRVIRFFPCTDEVIDLLAVLATSLCDANKNAASAVAFEVAQSILMLAKAAPQLLPLAQEILTKFLSHTNGDSNLRFVALNCMKRYDCFQNNQEIMQTVLACLHDADVSIRRAAMQVSLSLITRRTCALIVGHLLSFCRRERDDPEVVTECLKELRGVVGRYCQGPELLEIMIKLLRADSSKNPCELVRTFVNRIKKEIAKKRLTGPQVAKELFLALTVLSVEQDTTEETIEDASDDLSVTSSFHANNSTSSKPTVALMQATVWAAGWWSWRGIVDESLCTCGELIEFLIAMLGMQRSLRGYVLTALVRMAGQAERQSILTSLKGSKQEEDTSMAILLIEQNIYDEEEEEGDSGEVSSDEVSIDEVSESPVATSQPPQLETLHSSKFGKLNVNIDQVIKSPTGLQVQFIITAAPSQVLRDISIALAVSKEFDFEYLQPASTTHLSSPGDELSLAVVVKRRPSAKKQASLDLLDLLDEPPVTPSQEDEDFSSCQLRMRVQYSADDSSEPETFVSPIPL